jgi:N-acetyl sugar amidotransferase
MIRYCRRCVMPETKPDIIFDDEGVCSACVHFAGRTSVDWDARKAELDGILGQYRSPNGENYDCIIPVSGGKDSTYQTIRMLELGMNPLCVTATTDKLSNLGRRNIENLKRLGVDYIEVTPNPRVRRRINRLALTKVGDISWPEHVLIFTIPVRLAVQLRVPLIVWGENSQNEYGGPATAAQDRVLTRRWLEEFGGLLGLRVSDLIGIEGVAARDLIQYRYPSDEALSDVGVTGVFLGYFMPWDGWGNALISQAHGFESYPHLVEGSLVNYENLDNVQTGIHDYFKFLKYGFGRATDLACMQVRRGRLSREDAVRLVALHDGRFPVRYLGYPIEEVLNEIDMTLDEFNSVCDRFTNRKLFNCNRQGELVRDKGGNLVKVNYDNVDG